MIAGSFLKHIQFSLYVCGVMRMGYLHFVMAEPGMQAGGMIE